MQLWIALPVVNNPPATIPDNSTTDITLRRLHAFKVQPGKTYTWTLKRKGKLIEYGNVSPDAANLLTITQLPLNTTPAELSLKAKN